MACVVACVLQAGRTTITSVIRQQGLLRVLQGYDASYIREVGFSVVFLGAPGIASRVLGDEWKAADGSVTRESTRNLPVACDV